MDINKICPGCMQEVENRDSVGSCPHCGYNLSQIRSDSHQMQPFTILAGKYLVGKVIGEGGFGITYLGFDLNLELVVAIKEFYPNGFVTRESNVSTMVSMYAGKNEADVNKWREGFINEAKNLAKFSNLNGIVEVRDFFNENGTAYIVMEYIDGITLKQYLKQNGGKISADNTFQMMEPVIRSLSKVHDAGMIHRDISPDNIMITKYGGMKLLDFGAAREFAGNAEKSLSIMLKPGYAPEEQYRSRGKQGPWSDVYALTATIYKCITGVTPVESMERMREDTLKSPKELGANISDMQNAAIMQGMAVYAENRLQNMDALHTALYSNEGAVKAVEPPKIQTESEPPRPDTPNVSENTDSPHSGISSANGVDKKTILIGAAAVCGILLILLCAALIPKKPDSSQRAEVDSDALAAMADVSDDANNSPAADQGAVDSDDAGDSDHQEDSVDSLMAQGRYEDAIDKIMESGIGEAEGAETLQRAIDELYSQCINETSSLMDARDFDTAMSILDARMQYFLDVADRTGYVSDTYEYSLTEQRYKIGRAYVEYQFEVAGDCIANEDENGMLEALWRASEAEYASDDDNIDRKREKYYTDMVMIHLNNMNAAGSSSVDIMSYIDDNLAKTGNNCLIMELWHYYDDLYHRQIGVQRMQATSIRTYGAGYILPESDSRTLTYYDVDALTEYELYFALYEIYARHGRTFSDNEVNTHFRRFSWYQGNVNREDFDESVLSDVERTNIDFIINYQRDMGYR